MPDAVHAEASVEYARTPKPYLLSRRTTSAIAIPVLVRATTSRSPSRNGAPISDS